MAKLACFFDNSLNSREFNGDVTMEAGSESELQSSNGIEVKCAGYNLAEQVKDRKQFAVAFYYSFQL